MGCVPWNSFECSVIASAVKMNRQPTVYEFWEKSQAIGLVDHAKVMTLIVRWRQKMNEVVVRLLVACGAMESTVKMLRYGFRVGKWPATIFGKIHARLLSTMY
jgi:hypothetical protein